MEVTSNVIHVSLDWVNVCSITAHWIHYGTQIMFAVGRLCTAVVPTIKKPFIKFKTGSAYACPQKHQLPHRVHHKK